MFDDRQQYRYRMARSWGPTSEVVTFVLLNPSTADGHHDDPTTRRCISFARQWGFDGLHIVNLFAFVATDPLLLRPSLDPVGPANDEHILLAAGESRLVVAGWGNQGMRFGRDQDVLSLLGASGTLVTCFGLTKRGAPKHPLYLRKAASLRPLSARDQTAE